MSTNAVSNWLWQHGYILPEQEKFCYLLLQQKLYLSVSRVLG